MLPFLLNDQEGFNTRDRLFLILPIRLAKKSNSVEIFSQIFCTLKQKCFKNRYIVNQPYLKFARPITYFKTYNKSNITYAHWLDRGLVIFRVIKTAFSLYLM